ncbi:MAG TPA: SHOCT domain-containing protein [Rhizomicrobium sp.]|jgi:putative membrane protein|nr:SHOCT domain-containing protein [Rhizomicrobium sp.]
MFHFLWFWPLWFVWPFHGLLTLLVVILVVSLIFHRRHYYYYPYHYGPPPKGKSDALATLEERYARGEIQRDEYLQKRQDLGG